MKKTYQVRGMSCSACAATVERVLKKIDGVRDASVNLVLERVDITMDQDIAFDIFNEKIKKAGYELHDMQITQSKTYAIEGMFCAACSASVERILNKFDEIETASVNLIMNNVTITCKEVHFDKWKQALQKAGFTLVNDISLQEITLHVENATDEITNELMEMAGIHTCNLQDKQLSVTYDKKKLRLSEIQNELAKHNIQTIIEQDRANTKRNYDNLRIYSTLIVAFILLYIGMSHMMWNFKAPLPDIIHYDTHPFNFALIQFVLATIILIIGRHFFTRGFKALFHKAPNMDSLVALGTGSAYLFSIYSLYLISQGYMDAVHSLYFESAGVVIALVQFGKHLEHVSKVKSTGAISALLQLRPKTATLLRDQKEVEILSEEIEIGDYIVVKAGEHIAVDGMLIEGSAHVDESMLTGESMPVAKHKGDTLIQGTTNLDGRLVLECNVAQENTTLSNIIRMVEEAQGKKAPIARIADRVSLYFVPTVMIIATISALLWYLRGADFSFSLSIFISVLVIACPCALGLATPTAIMVGTGKAAQMGIFIKSGEALETASSIDTILFDKTGTITIGKPVVTDICTMEKDDEVLRIAAMLEQGSRHPLATAILQKVKDLQLSIDSLSDIQTDNGKGLRSTLNEHVIAVGSDTYMNSLNMDTSAYQKHAKQYQEQGKTVVWVAKEQSIMGIIGIADALKDNVSEVIDQLKHQGIQVYMVSGDHEISAKAIAKEAHIDHVIAQVLPSEKGDVVKRLQQEGKHVAMVGDGINDAIALTQSNVGIAIGSGSDVAIESADIVLVKDNIKDVLQSIRLSKAVIRNIRQNLFWAFFYNTLGIPIAAGLCYALHIFGGFLLSPVFAGAAMAFSSVSVVSNALRLRNFK